MKKTFSDIQIAAQIRLELIIWLGVTGRMLNLLVFQPLSFNSYKDIYMGMNVELPTSLSSILMYSDFMTAWWPVAIVLALGLIATMISFGKTMISSAGKVFGTEEFAALQLKLCSILVVAYLALSWLDGYIAAAVMKPLLALVNAS